jgi:hypothetical protein
MTWSRMAASVKSTEPTAGEPVEEGSNMDINEGSDRYITAPDYIPLDLLDEHQHCAFYQVRWAELVASIERLEPAPLPPPPPPLPWYANQVVVSGVGAALVATGIWGLANRSLPALTMAAAGALAATWVALVTIHRRRTAA